MLPVFTKMATDLLCLMYLYFANHKVTNLVFVQTCYFYILLALTSGIRFRHCIFFDANIFLYLNTLLNLQMFLLHLIWCVLSHWLYICGHSDTYAVVLTVRVYQNSFESSNVSISNRETPQKRQGEGKNCLIYLFTCTSTFHTTFSWELLFSYLSL